MQQTPLAEKRARLKAEREAHLAEIRLEMDRTKAMYKELAAGTTTLEAIKQDAVWNELEYQDKVIFTSLDRAKKAGQTELVELILLQTETEYRTYKQWGEWALRKWLNRIGDKSAADLVEQISYADYRGKNIYGAVHFGGGSPAPFPLTFAGLVGNYQDFQNAFEVFKESHPEPKKPSKAAAKRILRNMTLPQQNAARYLADALTLAKEMGLNEILTAGAVDWEQVYPDGAGAALNEYQAKRARA